jgi:hypothetical protein
LTPCLDPPKNAYIEGGYEGGGRGEGYTHQYHVGMGEGMQKKLLYLFGCIDLFVSLLLTKNHHAMEISSLVLKATLLNTIFAIKHGEDLHPNQRITKRTLCNFFGVSPKINNKKYLLILKECYTQGGIVEEFNETLAKYGVEL